MQFLFVRGDIRFAPLVGRERGEVVGTARLFEIFFQIARVHHLCNFPVLEICRRENLSLVRIADKMGIAALAVSLSPEMKRHRFAFRDVYTPYHGHTVGILPCQKCCFHTFLLNCYLIVSDFYRCFSWASWFITEAKPTSMPIWFPLSIVNSRSVSLSIMDSESSS